MMIKRLLIIFILLTVGISAQAATDLGPRCWNAAPFQDQLRVWAVIATDPGVTMIAIPTGFWQGPGAYQMNLVGGSVNLSYPIPGTLSMSLRFDNASSFFGGRPNCRFRADLDPNTFNGPWFIRCTDPEAAGVFLISGNLVNNVCLGPITTLVQQLQFQSDDRPLAGNAPQ